MAIDRYSNRKFLLPTFRTIITSDPQTEEGLQMSSDARNLNRGLLQDILDKQPETFIRNL